MNMPSSIWMSDLFDDSGSSVQLSERKVECGLRFQAEEWAYTNHAKPSRVL